MERTTARVAACVHREAIHQGTGGEMGPLGERGEGTLEWPSGGPGAVGPECRGRESPDGTECRPPLPCIGIRRRITHAFPPLPRSARLAGRWPGSVGMSDDQRAKPRKAIQPPNNLLSQPKKPPPPCSGAAGRDAGAGRPGAGWGAAAELLSVGVSGAAAAGAAGSPVRLAATPGRAASCICS